LEGTFGEEAENGKTERVNCRLGNLCHIRLMQDSKHMHEQLWESNCDPDSCGEEQKGNMKTWAVVERK